MRALGKLLFLLFGGMVALAVVGNRGVDVAPAHQPAPNPPPRRAPPLEVARRPAPAVRAPEPLPAPAADLVEEAAADDGDPEDEAMADFEDRRAEWNAAHRVDSWRTLKAAAKRKADDGDDREAERIEGRAKQFLKQAVELWPDTEAAADAAKLLAGEDVPVRPLPQAPTLPPGIKAAVTEAADFEVSAAQRQARSYGPGSVGTSAPGPRTGGVRATTVRVGTARHAPSAQSVRTVHVRAYTREDGTHVRSHTRSSPRR